MIRTNGNIVVEEIMNQISSGNYEPGDKLPTIIELSNNLGVGIGTIREAIKTLNFMKILDIQQGKGVFISNVSINSLINRMSFLNTQVINEKTIKDLYQIRKIFEVFALRFLFENNFNGLNELVKITNKIITASKKMT